MAHPTRGRRRCDTAGTTCSAAAPARRTGPSRRSAAWASRASPIAPPRPRWRGRRKDEQDRPASRRRRSDGRRMRDSNSRGLHPTRFPTMLPSVHQGSPQFVTWPDCDGWVAADIHEPRRMRPHLRPAAPGALSAAWTSSCGLPEPGTVPHRRASRPDGAGRRGTSCHHRGLADLPRPGKPSSRSHGVTGGGARPTHTQRRTPITNA